MVSVQRDYIMRIIEQLGQVIATVVGLRRSGYEDQALAAIVREAGQLLGVDLEALRSLNPADGLRALHAARLTVAGASDCEWWIAITVLLEEATELHRLRGEEDDARHTEQLAGLALDQIPVDDESTATLNTLIAASDGAEPLPTSLRTVIWLYHERAGAYAQAEDWLFDLLESGPPGDDLVRRGAAFYQRLDDLTDDELIRGGLPRAEVQEGLDYLWELAAQDDPAG